MRQDGVPHSTGPAVWMVIDDLLGDERGAVMTAIADLAARRAEKEREQMKSCVRNSGRRDGRNA